MTLVGTLYEEALRRPGHRELCPRAVSEGDGSPLPALAAEGHMWRVLRPHLGSRVLHIHCRALQGPSWCGPWGLAMENSSQWGQLIIFGLRGFTGYVTWLILNYT